MVRYCKRPRTFLQVRMGGRLDPGHERSDGKTKRPASLCRSVERIADAPAEHPVVMTPTLEQMGQCGTGPFRPKIH